MTTAENAVGRADGAADAMTEETEGTVRSIGSLRGAHARYGGSLWNAWLDAKLALDLTVAEHRLADALARNMLGYGGLTVEALGNNLLRRESRLDGRSFERAREGLAAKGLIHFSTSGRGRGARTEYVLRIDETTAPERSFESTALERSFPTETTAAMTARVTALRRSRITDEGENPKGSLPITEQGAIAAARGARDVGPDDPDWRL